MVCTVSSDLVAPLSGRGGAKKQRNDSHDGGDHSLNPSAILRVVRSVKVCLDDGGPVESGNDLRVSLGARELQDDLQCAQESANLDGTEG
jgi:hypothetical protein